MVSEIMNVQLTRALININKKEYGEKKQERRREKENFKTTQYKERE